MLGVSIVCHMNNLIAGAGAHNRIENISRLITITAGENQNSIIYHNKPHHRIALNGVFWLKFVKFCL